MIVVRWLARVGRIDRSAAGELVNMELSRLPNDCAAVPENGSLLISESNMLLLRAPRTQVWKFDLSPFYVAFGEQKDQQVFAQKLRTDNSTTDCGRPASSLRCCTRWRYIACRRRKIRWFDDPWTVKVLMVPQLRHSVKKTLLHAWMNSAAWVRRRQRCMEDLRLRRAALVHCTCLCEIFRDAESLAWGVCVLHCLFFGVGACQRFSSAGYRGTSAAWFCAVA